MMINLLSLRMHMIPLRTCNDDTGGGSESDPAHHGEEVHAGEALEEGEEVGGAHDDEAGEERVHHQVPGPEVEEEGGLDCLRHHLRIHPPLLFFFYL